MTNNSTFIERMQDEATQLTDRMEKLEAFMATEIFAGLGSMKQWLLREQYHAMVAYRRILATRVEVHLGDLQQAEQTEKTAEGLT